MPSADHTWGCASRRWSSHAILMGASATGHVCWPLAMAARLGTYTRVFRDGSFLMPRGCRQIVLLAGFCLVPGLTGLRAADEFAFHRENVMGTSLELRVAADDYEAARSAEGR